MKQLKLLHKTAALKSVIEKLTEEEDEDLEDDFKK